jgi:DNA-binding NarL/FixJ family response regulator
MLKDASASEVVAAVRAVARAEAVCPPGLCRVLFSLIAKQFELIGGSTRHFRAGLTRREQQLLPLISQGLTNKEIATKLGLSEQTVKNHIHRILRKVGAEDRSAISAAFCTPSLVVLVGLRTVAP